MPEIVFQEKKDLDHLLDVTAINKKMADRKDNPYRWRVGSFHVPKNLPPEMFNRVCREAINRWLPMYEKEGWTLASKVQVYGKWPARDLMTGAVLLDRDEYRARAIFKADQKLKKTVRTYIPESLIKKTDNQKVSLADIAKDTGMRPVPLKKRPIR